MWFSSSLVWGMLNNWAPFTGCAPLCPGKNLYLKCTPSPFYCAQKIVRSTLGHPVPNCISSLEQMLWTIGASLWTVAFFFMLTLHQVSAVDEADAEVDPPQYRSDAVLVQALSMLLGTSWPPVKFHMWLVQSQKKDMSFLFPGLWLPNHPPPCPPSILLKQRLRGNLSSCTQFQGVEGEGFPLCHQATQINSVLMPSPWR